MLRTILTGVLIALTAAATNGADRPLTFALPHYDDILVVPVTIGGQEHSFVLDSGASVNAFDLSLENHLGEAVGQIEAGGPHASQVKTKVYPSPDAQVGGLPLTKRARCGCTDLKNVREATGRDIRGILGMPVFATSTIQVNFDRHELRLLPEDADPVAEWGVRINVDFNQSNVPIALATLAGEFEEPCVIDTGMNGAIATRSFTFEKLVDAKHFSPKPDMHFAVLGAWENPERVH